MNSKETINETGINTQNYSKEFSYLNQLKWKIPFNLICTKSIICEDNFFSTLARYIEKQKEKNISWWEVEIQNLVSSIINGKYWKWIDLLKNINTLFLKKQIERYSSQWEMFYVEYLEDLLKYSDYVFKDQWDWKTSTVLAWIASNLVPERYFKWSADNWLINEIRDKNIENLAKVFSWNNE